MKQFKALLKNTSQMNVGEIHTHFKPSMPKGIRMKRLLCEFNRYIRETPLDYGCM